MGLPDERGVEDGAVLSGAALNLVGSRAGAVACRSALGCVRRFSTSRRVTGPAAAIAVRHLGESGSTAIGY
jgi:hypothetical protein